MMSCELDSAGPLLKRHCALCLKEISGHEIKKCGKCHKRAYCSKKCQTEDWTPNKKKGQGHKNWCGIDYGEEDVDWMVTPVPGKGLGLIALRDIPAVYRIIVEGGVGKTHPRVADLTPHNGSLAMKYDLNSLTCGKDDDEESVLCLRIARANHSCAPNATHYYDNSVKTVILFSLRDIKKGEEICNCYTGFDYPSRFETPEKSREVLQRQWGIFCDQNCLCYDKAYCDKIKRRSELNAAIMRFKLTPSSAGRKKIPETLALLEELLEFQKEMNFEVINRWLMLDVGFQIAITKQESVELAIRYITEAYELVKRIVHPEHNEQVKKYQMCMRNPQTHRYYLAMEKRD